jgi:hypothetical protein
MDCCPALQAAPLGEAQAVMLSAMFKALSDPVRLRLLSLIASYPGGEACVCEISATFDVSQPIPSLITSNCCARPVCWAASAAVPGSITG